MKRFVSVLTLVLAVVVLSSCAYFPSTIKNEKIIADFHRRLKKEKTAPEKVGNPNIKFYVNIIDQRKGELKNAFTGKLDFYGIVTAHYYAKNLNQTIKYDTEYTLKQAGWGVTENPDKANYVITIKVNDFYRHDPTWSPVHYDIDTICITSKNDNIVFKKKVVYHGKKIIFWDSHADNGYLSIAGYLLKLYHDLYIKVFTSQEFKNAVERD